jgi:two-component system alkaline phosphatase synthesis response regulator PhoP
VTLDQRPRPRLLLAEDEPALVLTLTDRLVSEGYDVEAVPDGAAAVEKARKEPFDLLLLDVALPVKDGFEVCRELRQLELALPILMLTARSQVVDRVVGLKLGADDYLTKPFEMIELLARVQALLRRARAPAGNASDTYGFGRLRLDYRRAQLWRDDELVELSALEYKLLRHFIAHRGEVLSRDELLDRVWGYDATPQTRTVDVHVASLRRKIEDHPAKPRHIVTVHGLGYRFTG